jgi:hypothetical protein
VYGNDPAFLEMLYLGITSRTKEEDRRSSEAVVFKPTKDAPKAPAALHRILGIDLGSRRTGARGH